MRKEGKIIRENPMLERIKKIVMFYVLGGEKYARRIGVRVGTGCRIYTKHFGSEPFLISIGDRVTVTSGVQFITHDGSTWLIRDACGRRYKFSSIAVGDDVFIGVNTIILPGVQIGSRCVIGAGSVITKSIPSNSVAVGTPARVIGSFDAFEAKILGGCVSQAEMPTLESLPYEIWVRTCMAKSESRQGRPK
jgi:acetyltransferase-like isoleucine patch superfamily enzyme